MYVIFEKMFMFSICCCEDDYISELNKLFVEYSLVDI